jgi:heptosyltransferase-2
MSKTLLFPVSSLAKRAAVAGMRLYGRVLPSAATPLEPTNSADLRILIQSMGGIGNTLMATPLIAEMRRLYPGARIDVLTTPDAAALLATNPHATAILTDPTSGTAPRTRGQKLPSLAYWRSLWDTRRSQYDACFLALNAIDLRSALRPVLARIPIRVIHAYRFRSEDDFTHLFTHRAPYVEGRHDCAGDLDLLRSVTDAEVRDCPMVLPVNEEHIAAAVATLSQRGWRPSSLTVGLCPGCRHWARDKRWPPERYAELALSLLSSYDDANVIAFCGPHDVEEAECLRQAVRDSRFRVVEGLDLLTYAGALKQCRLVVSNDSLPMHMCAALQVPVVALFGPTNPARVGPWMCRSRVVVSKADYAPYFEMPYFRDLGVGDPCMSTIAKSDVLAATRDLLERTEDETRPC